ncbi:MAG TPA: hypothetical protein VFJ72_11585 [Rubrobacteraceae bacterium]|nr:hypothetical protein [Rubrobacteraceae bacterium]
MQHDSLFGHLASRFSGQTENIATESLNYIINRSSVARRAFLQFVAQANVELPDTLLFQTQAVGDDNAIPDLVGTDSESRQVLLVEAKFWAGLTGNQPVTYLKRLPSQADGLLLFIAPALRLDTLWSELLRRCQDESVAIEQSPNDIAQDFREVRVGHTHTLALTSWRAVLAYILRVLETEGEYRAVSDVQQLQGLCERMDSGAFLPLRSEELTSDTGARVRQYCEIVNAAISQAREADIASTEGLRPTSGPGFYGRYLRLQGHQCHLQFNADLWGRLRATPLWLRIDHLQSKPWMKDALASLEREQPPRLIPGDRDLLVPINLPTGIEKQEVVSAVFKQMKEVAELLRHYNQSEQETATGTSTSS